MYPAQVIRLLGGSCYFNNNNNNNNNRHTVCLSSGQRILLACSLQI